MKLKNQLAIFNVITRLLLILVLVVALPKLVEAVVYKHINKTLQEKKLKFIEHLGDKEINEFLDKSDNADTYASFSILHDEFILLSKIGDGPVAQKSVFLNEPRLIEGQQDDYRILQYTFGYENKRYQLEVGSSLAEIKDLTFMIRIFTLAILLVIVLATFLMDSVYLDHLLKPFYKIIDTKIRRVNDPNAFNFTAIASKTEDFKELDEVLNQMMTRIEQLFRQERQFIGNVSHELLSPISLLKNRLENLLQNPSLDHEAIDKIASSLRTLDLLKRIINNLLLISKIENNQFEQSEVVSVKDLIGEIAEDLEDRLQDREISLQVTLKQDFVFLANRTLLHILLFNILSNAVKYNHRQGSIEISEASDAEHYSLLITDSGKGMTTPETENIFKRFARLDHEQEGQGLGLAIVDSIAQFHGIKIAVVSEPEIGTTFTVSFPKKPMKS